MENKTDNELIAKFMGVTITEHKNYSEKRGGYFDIPEYDKSWSELMPVVEKIESIRHIGIDAIYLKIEGRKCQIWTYFDVKEFLRLTGDDNNDKNKFKVGHSAKTKIEATYHACLDFIKWYNDHGKQ